MTRRAASTGNRLDRARRAFELTLAGHSTRVVSEMMQAEGYKQIGHVTVSKLVRQYGESIVLPLAKEHVTREFERLMEQRVRLDVQRDRAWEICNRFHFATNNAGVIMVLDPITQEPRPVRDSGPELQALTVMQGIEKLVLANADALAKLFGYRAPEESKVTVTTEVDKAVADLVGEMNARDAAPARSVRA
jgi:hypothetical protein